MMMLNVFNVGVGSKTSIVNFSDGHKNNSGVLLKLLNIVITQI